MIAEPMGPRILVRPDPPPETLRGIARPESAEHRPESGSVVALGPQAGAWLCVGDEIAFPAYAGYRIRVGGEELLVLMPDEVMFRVKKEWEGAPA